MKRYKFNIAAVFDTETCNLGSTAADARAIPILYIDNDIRDVNLYDYEPDKDDYVQFFRYENEYIEQLKEYISWGKVCDVVPVVCAYNLMFDLQSLLEKLSLDCDIEVNAQSSTNVYVFDLHDKTTGDKILRFWDTFHLDMRGLSKMGEIAGLEKAIGDWDYSLIRTPETPLTDEELFYAKRDVQVIPMFLRFLLRTNDWMKQGDLGSKVLTKTSLVRQMAKREIGSQRILKGDGKRITVEKMFLELCKQEQPKSYNQYALRKSSFRGGFTFTAAAFASTIQTNVVSVDVTSMHHTFINGRFIPDKFHYTDNDALTVLVARVLSTSREYVMKHYEKPFNEAFHIRCAFNNIRLKRNSAFKEWGIALLSLSKFKLSREYIDNEAKYEGENAIIEEGWHDSFRDATFAFGKLYKARKVVLHLNEIELWTMSRVYEWDSFEVLYGESTLSFCRPPDYVTLQSNILYKQKDDNKFIANHYVEGESYPYRIPDNLPEAYKIGLRDGSLSWADFNAYYVSDTKGKFNGIYGTMAQDIYRPSYICRGGVIEVDRESIARRNNWEEIQPKTCKVLYTYGMRIVGGSRLHMVLAIERVFEAFKNSARVLGGDTDSMKISLDDSITDDDLQKCLDVFESISKHAIDKTMERVRKYYPKQASTLRGIGGFEIENRGNHYVCHIELWNKCRCSIDSESGVHITCAGLPRPSNAYHIERFIRELLEKGREKSDVLKMCVGYNVFVCNEVCHTLESHRPNPTDRFVGYIEDYTGRKTLINVHEVVCLYPTGRWLGETLKQQNMNTIEYLRQEYGRSVDTSVRYLWVKGNVIEVCKNTKHGMETIALGESAWLKSHTSR